MRAAKQYLHRISHSPHFGMALINKLANSAKLVPPGTNVPLNSTGQHALYVSMMRHNHYHLLPIYLQLLMHKFPYRGVNRFVDYQLYLRCIQLYQTKIIRLSKLIQEAEKKKNQDQSEEEDPQKSFKQQNTYKIQMDLSIFKNIFGAFAAAILATIFLTFYINKEAKTQQKEIQILKNQQTLIDEETLVKKLLENLQQIRIKEVKRDYCQFQVIFIYSDNSKEIFRFNGNINNLLSMIEHFEMGKFQRTPIHYDHPKYSPWETFGDALSLLTPFIGLAITLFIFRRFTPDSIIGKLSNKRNFKIQGLRNIKVRFADVAGMEQAKKQITQFVDFLKHGEKYREMGAKIPKGALLTGPPGTGKTMLAKACAGEAEVSFFYISGSQFVQMFVGLGASKVRELFQKARMQAPSIIFIDEIDAIGKKRQSSRNEQKDSTLNQLLVEMDGFSSHETVIILAATNRKDTLDNALTRPGRFDRMVEVTLPEIKAREDIFKVHLKPLRIDPEKSLESLSKRLAQLTPGFSGADIANLCNEAAIIATRRQKKYIEDKDFEDASERITAGYEKKNLVNQKTKKRVAYHQAGHAVCGWFLKGGDPLIKLTIIPRSKGALGYAQYLPKSSYIRTRSELVDQIAIMLGGMTSQELNFGSTSSGASDDLQKVYQVARKMIAEYGMGIKTYNVTLDQQSFVRKQSQSLAKTIDQQMSALVEEGRARCRQVLQKEKERLSALADMLLDKQTINSEEIKGILGQRPF